MVFTNYVTALQKAGHCLNPNNPIEGREHAWAGEYFYKDVINELLYQVHSDVISNMNLGWDNIYSYLTEEYQNCIREIRVKRDNKDLTWEILMEEALLKRLSNVPDEYARLFYEGSSNIVTLLLEIHWLEALEYGNTSYWPLGKPEWAKTIMRWVNEYVEFASKWLVPVPFPNGHFENDVFINEENDEDWELEDDNTWYNPKSGRRAVCERAYMYEFIKDFQNCWDTKKAKKRSADDIIRDAIETLIRKGLILNKKSWQYIAYVIIDKYFWPTKPLAVCRHLREMGFSNSTLSYDSLRQGWKPISIEKMTKEGTTLGKLDLAMIRYLDKLLA